MFRRTIFFALPLLCITAATAISGDPAKPKAKENTPLDQAFEKLKTLVGEWEITTKADHIPPNAKITYRVIGGGSAVIETMFPGSKMEMVSVYHRDGDKIVMTHFCAAGNQPRFKGRVDPKTGDLILDFAGGTNLDVNKDMHVHNGRIHFIDGKTLESEWEFYMDGKSGGLTKFQMKRLK